MAADFELLIKTVICFAGQLAQNSPQQASAEQVGERNILSTPSL